MRDKAAADRVGQPDRMDQRRRRVAQPCIAVLGAWATDSVRVASCLLYRIRTQRIGAAFKRLLCIREIRYAANLDLDYHQLQVLERSRAA